MCTSEGEGSKIESLRPIFDTPMARLWKSLGNKADVFLLIVTTIFVQAYLLQLAVSASKVKFLPGFEGPLPFHLQTGYIEVGEAEDVQLFYYFVKSERNPKQDPLMVWINGGPGCSGWSGLVYEIGPLIYKVEKYNGSVPRLVYNPYSWTKFCNIIFMDTPVGTGFSYATTSLASQSGDFNQADHLSQFLRKWLIDHPKFISNPVYIAGDSFSGITVPILALKISNENAGGVLPSINLQGYVLGNPVTDPLSEGNYEIPFSHGMALISDELYESLKKNCAGEYKNIDPSNIQCLKDMKTYEKCTSGVDMLYTLEPSCTFEYSNPQDKVTIHGKPVLLDQKSQLSILHSDASPILTPGCREFDHLLSSYWANDPSVRKSLRVREGTTKEWQRCNFNLPYQHEVLSSIEYHLNLSAKGYRSLIYSGDHDLRVTFLATQAWIRSLNYSIVDDWRPWIVEGHVAGAPFFTLVDLSLFLIVLQWLVEEELGEVTMEAIGAMRILSRSWIILIVFMKIPIVLSTSVMEITQGLAWFRIL